ncbi:hypothetical protein COA01_23115 [Bacillus cereus]|uniref:hypothetical protein n=1 Tax=Bacillus cereus TaxID=1396 RepID=UPI000BFCB6A4|nr:hypothetical protein [Bacillus cereus]PGP18636.1 hypothetical protein COA01_23115 [Bacillus cereus]
MEITEKMIRDVQKKRAIYMRMAKTISAFNKERFGKEIEEYQLEMDPDKIREEFQEAIDAGAVDRITIKMAKSILESTQDEKIVFNCLKHVGTEEPEKILQQAKDELETEK